MTTRDIVIQAIANQLDGDASKISPDMVLRAAPLNFDSLDSLDQIGVIMEIEDRLSIQLDETFIDRCRTVANVIEYVESIVA